MPQGRACRTRGATPASPSSKSPIVSAIIAILASAILPLAKVTMQREREVELRRELRDMRTAIDKFKDAADQGKIAPGDLPAGADGYPPTMQVLVDGVASPTTTPARASGSCGAFRSIR